MFASALGLKRSFALSTPFALNPTVLGSFATASLFAPVFSKHDAAETTPAPRSFTLNIITSHSNAPLELTVDMQPSMACSEADEDEHYLSQYLPSSTPEHLTSTFSDSSSEPDASSHADDSGYFSDTSFESDECDCILSEPCPYEAVILRDKPLAPAVDEEDLVSDSLLLEVKTRLATIVEEDEFAEASFVSSKLALPSLAGTPSSSDVDLTFSSLVWRSSAVDSLFSTVPPFDIEFDDIEFDVIECDESLFSITAPFDIESDDDDDDDFFLPTPSSPSYSSVPSSSSTPKSGDKHDGKGCYIDTTAPLPSIELMHPEMPLLKRVLIENFRRHIVEENRARGWCR